MDWIERWFGISPDGGNGSTELLYMGAVLAVLALVAGHRFVICAKVAYLTERSRVLTQPIGG